MNLVALNTFKEIGAFKEELAVFAFHHLRVGKDTFAEDDHRFFDGDLDAEEDTKDVKVGLIVSFAEGGHKLDQVVLEELKKFVLVHLFL